MGQERRRFPRVHSQIAADVTTSGGQAVAATVLNLSRVGLQLGCDGSTAAGIVPHAQRPYPDHAIVIDVSLTLPFAARRPVGISMRCRVVYCQPASEGSLAIGVEFVDFEGDGYQFLEGFIVECMRHA